MIKCQHYVYLLKSTSTRRTYIGYTIDPQRRLRQHNGEIVGGAKYTRYGRPWIMVLYITGFPCHRTALQYEWRCHHPPKRFRKKGAGIYTRITQMYQILSLEKFTNSCIPSKNLKLFTVWLEPKYNKNNNNNKYIDPKS